MEAFSYHITPSSDPIVALRSSSAIDTMQVVCFKPVDEVGLSNLQMGHIAATFAKALNFFIAADVFTQDVWEKYVAAWGHFIDTAHSWEELAPFLASERGEVS